MNTTPVVPYYFQSHEVRTITIENEPWFVAKDVCDVLGIANPTQAVQQLDEDERAMQNIGRQGETNIISESGLYTLIIRSNKPQAKPFRKWVTAEVLPAIRKTGTYTKPTKRQSLWPDNNAALALAKTREGEFMARELTLGVKVARAIGLHGRRQILEHAAALVGGRTGSDPLAYFGVKLDQHCPKNIGNGDSIGKFIESECRICRDSEERLVNVRVRIRTVYDHYIAWYRNMVDDRLRGIPSINAVSRELRRRGAMISKIGGTSYVFGLILVEKPAIGGGKKEVMR